MIGGRSIQLLRVAGIRVGVHPSWFLVVGLLVFLLADQFEAMLVGATPTAGFLVAVAAALLFFGSIALHELGHALEARRSGIGVDGIDLWFFGGVAKLSRDTSSPGEELRVAGAGPAVSLALALGFYALAVVLGGAAEARDVIGYQADATGSVAVLLCANMAVVNAALLVFNLVPAFPLDGGRIARAGIWKATGSRPRATRYAARGGEAFAWLLGAYGLFTLLQSSGFDGLWLMLLAFFLHGAARDAVVGSKVEEALAGTTVADVMVPVPVTVPADQPVLEVREGLLEQFPYAAVTGPDGRFLGVLSRQRADALIAEGRPALTAHEAAEGEGSLGVREDESLEALTGSDGLRSLGAVFAVGEAGELRGVVTLDGLRRALAT